MGRELSCDSKDRMAAMIFSNRKVNPNNDDFISLVHELNASLHQITNDTGEGSFSPEDFDSASDGCIVVYSNEKPVACGVFRYHAPEVCELKRMYSKQPGAGAYLIEQLENDAVSKGYRKAILSTRRINHKAIAFYERHSYAECHAYGRYVGVNRSICLSKVLSQNT